MLREGSFGSVGGCRRGIFSRGFGSISRVLVTGIICGRVVCSAAGRGCLERGWIEGVDRAVGVR
jgi:hypothetical protein